MGGKGKAKEYLDQLHAYIRENCTHFRVGSSYF
jgi:hypothetical protein